MTYQKILLASHGTDGAKAAETQALDLCARQSPKPSIHHLLVVPDFWKGMMGDDWLNNAVTQIRFGKYVENQLANEAADARLACDSATDRRQLYGLMNADRVNRA